MSQERETILVVDDDSVIRMALEQILKNSGYRVLTASDGEAGLEILKQQPISVIICDQFMPGIQGAELLKESIELQPEAVRIGLTGLSDLNTFKDLVNVGKISHFILKPWDNDMLLQTVKDSLNRVALVRENRKLNEELKQQHAILMRELQLGGKIQNSVLIGHVPQNTPGLDVKAITYPSKEIDGDFFEFYRPSPKCLDIVLADVMGKGLPAALVGTAVKTQLTRYAVPVSSSRVYSRSSGWRKDIFSPETIMTHVQSQVSKALIDLEYFVCLSYARFDMERRVMTMVDCGSAKPIHYRSKEKKTALIKGHNFPIGMVPNDQYQNVSVHFKKDDLFVFYSDGVTEAQNSEGEQYGTDRLQVFIERHATSQSQELIDQLKEELIEFTGRDAFDDDLTLVVVKVMSKAVDVEHPRIKTSKFAADLSQLQVVRDFVSRVCVNVPGDVERLSNQLQLAVNEAYCNIVEHGYSEGKEGEIEVDIELTYEGVVVTIRDQGRSFEPDQIQDPSFAGDKYGGFGLFMIKQLIDHIAYSPKETEEGWNQLTLLKHYLADEVHMNFSHQQQDDIMTITLEGTSLDAKEAPAFKQDVINLITDQNVSHVILNLQKLNFIDSSGLGSFLSILRQLNNKGGDLKMAGMNKSIRTVFELVCMHKIFEIYNTPEEAIKSLKKASV